MAAEATDACTLAEKQRDESDRRRVAAEQALARGQQTWFENSQRLRTQLQAAIESKAQSKSGWSWRHVDHVSLQSSLDWFDVTPSGVLATLMRKSSQQPTGKRESLEVH